MFAFKKPKVTILNQYHLLPGTSFGDMRQERLSRHESHLRIWQRAIGFCAFALLSFFGSRSDADIATDGTVGPARNLIGPDFRIGAELGTTRGANLFHSFQTFSILTGESATFTGPDNIANVISRVTGGETSTIDGLLHSEVGQADFFFINPAGVMFGPKAQVDVPAAFHVGTADELRFEDGAVFSAVDPAASNLSVARPESFGFLSPQPASITINGSQLEFAPNSRASIAAGDVTIQGAASLVSDGGDIQITAVGESGDVVPLADGPANSAGNGTIAITESSTIDVSGTEGSETVKLRGGFVEIVGSKIKGGTVEVHATDSITITGSGPAATGGIFTRPRSELGANGASILLLAPEARVTIADGGILQSGGVAGNSGSVSIEANELRILNLSGVDANTFGSGAAGNICIQVSGSISLENRSFIQAATYGTGPAGRVVIRAGDLGVLNRSEITASTFATGPGGSVDIDIAGSLLIEDGSVIGNLTSEGPGRASGIRVKATTLEIRNGGSIARRLSGNNRDGGTIVVEATDLVIDGEGTASTGILSEAFSGLGKAGDIRVTATGRLEISNGGRIRSVTRDEGTAGRIIVSATELIITGDNSGIISEPFLSSGSGGEVQVTVNERLAIFSGGRISTDASGGQGAAGTITVTAQNLVIDGKGLVTGILGRTLGSSGAAAGVQVTTTERLEIRHGGQISASSGLGGGNAGSVTVTADELLIDGEGAELTGIFSDAFGTLTGARSGTAGDVRVTAAQRLDLRNGGQISAISGFGGGDAGGVIVDTGELIMEARSRITTSSIEANGGPIRIIGRNNIVMRDSLITTSVEGLTGDGGNINLNANALILEGGFIQANTAAPKARGGDVFIDTKALIASHDLLEVGGTERLTFQPGSGRNVIQAAAPGGEQGSITITSPDLDISSALLTLSTPFVEAARLVSDPCTVAAGEAANSLIPRGRGGIPAGPEQPEAVFFGGERLDRLLDTEIKSPATNLRTGGESSLNSTLTDCQRVQ
jgi:filamentous hemagglutinin family protein